MSIFAQMEQQNESQITFHFDFNNCRPFTLFFFQYFLELNSEHFDSLEVQ